MRAIVSCFQTKRVHVRMRMRAYVRTCVRVCVSACVLLLLCDVKYLVCQRKF